MRAKKLVIPKFPSEQAEARWFDRNRAKLQADMGRRLRSGETMTLAEALKASAAKEKAALRPVTLRMPPEDLEAARHLAEIKGLPYQTYMKMLLREALRRATSKERAYRS